MNVFRLFPPSQEALPEMAIDGGTMVSSLFPHTFMRGESLWLVLFGVNLQQVIGLDFFPADGINGSRLVVSADGTELSLLVDVSTRATRGRRELWLRTEDGQPVFTSKGLSPAIMIE